MAKVTLSSIGAGKGDIDLLNANFTAISTAMDNTLSRDGTATNTMGAQLDMNSNRIINLTAPLANSDAARLVDVTAGVQASFTTTSTTSTTIGTGSKVFTVDADKFFAVGGWVLIASDADETNYMHGQITAYSTTSMTVLVDNIGGSGTLADWTITLSGTRGAAGADGPMTGPGSATDNAVTRFDGATGDTVQGSSVIIDDSDAVTGITSLTVDNVNINGNSIISTDTDGDINLTPDGTGSVVCTPLLDVTAGQIKFPATQNASADVNTLDDYEEGTWTPVLTFATPGNLNVVYSTQSGTYTKIGRQVTVNFNIETSTFTHTTASGSARITGLPVAGASGAQNGGSMRYQGITKASFTSFMPIQSGTDTSLLIGASGSAQTSAFIDEGDMPTGGSIILRGTVTYFV